MDGDDLRGRVLALVRAEGFALAGVAEAAVLDEARAASLEHQRRGLLDGLSWITPAWLERATDPGVFLAGARSVILVALPAHAPTPQVEAGGPGRGRIARYARGRDYHRVFEKRLRRIARSIREDLGAGARATVDYGPLLERPLAARAGLGWLGKSTMLLIPGFGPWVLLGAIATTLPLAPDPPLRKSCGSCTRCVAACPTGALGSDGSVLDARLCISYHTIENRGPIPRDLRARFGDWIFGCDDCLDSCPAGATNAASHPGFAPASLDDARPQLAPLLQLDEAAFAERYRGRAILRAKRDGFLRNVCVALGNAGTVDDFPALAGALGDPSPLVRGHAAWAIAALALRTGQDQRARAVLDHRLAVEADAFVRDELLLALDVAQ